MKKLSLIVAVAFSVMAASTVRTQAQTLAANQGYLLKAGTVHSTTPPTDTVTNTGVVNQVVSISGYHDVISFQSTITKLSGTGAGTIALYASLDNVGFVALPNQSFSITDVASQSFLWQLTPSGYPYYQLRITGSGTESLKVKSIYTWRDKPLR